jgi:spore germination cell wall hydrolase CwlJ-like protein
MCMTLAIYMEAQGESLRGKQAVAEVVNNRSIAWNKSTCDVVFQKGQFSWTRHTKTPPKNHQNNPKWEECMVIAKKYVHTNQPTKTFYNPTNHTNGRLYFNSGSRFCINGKMKGKVDLKIGGHVFCH